mgnify:CR=1 FL=1
MPLRSFFVLLSASLCLSLPVRLEARTWTVGPSGREYTQLSTLFNANDLAPGDIVEVDGNATYTSVVVGDNDGGVAGKMLRQHGTPPGGDHQRRQILAGLAPQGEETGGKS